MGSGQYGGMPEEKPAEGASRGESFQAEPSAV